MARERPDTITIYKKPRKKRKQTTPIHSAGVSRQHGGHRAGTGHKQLATKKRLMNTDLNLLAQHTDLPIDTLKRLKAEAPSLFMDLAIKLEYQQKLVAFRARFK